MQTLEEALQRIKDLETENAGLKGEKSSLIANRDTILAEKKELSAKLKVLGDVDPSEAIAVYNRHKNGELVVKDALEGELKGEWEKQSSKQLKELQDQIKQIREEKEAEKAARIKATVHGTFTSLFAPQLNTKPKHLLTILESEGRIKLSETGEPVGVYKGEELTPEDFVKRLRDDEDYQGYFKPSGASGSGKTFGEGTKKQSNPFTTGNIQAQMVLYKQNRQEYDRLKAEANGK